MDSKVFLHVARGNRAGTYLRLQMEAGYTYKFLPDYSGMEMPVKLVEDMELGTKRNQTWILEAPCTINPVRDYKALVSVNPLLAQYADVSLMQLIDPGEKQEQIQVIAHFRKDMDLSKLDWLCRIYLLS